MPVREREECEDEGDGVRKNVVGEGGSHNEVVRESVAGLCKREREEQIG